MERSVEAKSYRSFWAWLYSKSNWEGFGGMQSGVLERLRHALGKRGSEGARRLSQKTARLEDDRRLRKGREGNLASELFCLRDTVRYPWTLLASVEGPHRGPGSSQIPNESGPEPSPL